MTAFRRQVFPIMAWKRRWRICDWVCWLTSIHQYVSSRSGVLTRLDAGEPTEPHHVEVSHPERGDRPLVVGDRNVFDGHSRKRGLQMVGEETVRALEPLGLLIGNRPDP